MVGCCRSAGPVTRILYFAPKFSSYFIWRLGIFLWLSVLESQWGLQHVEVLTVNRDFKSSFLLQVEPGCSSEMLLPIYQTRGRLIPEATILICIFTNILIFIGDRGGAVGWGTALQVGRSRVRFPMMSLEFFINIILLAALWPWSRLNL